MGLVNRAVEGAQTLGEALNYAPRTGGVPARPASWQTIKQQLADADQLSLQDAYEQATRLMIPALASADHREGVAAMAREASGRASSQRV